MERFVKKIAVVTGAAEGIGAATVKELLKSGLNVVGLDIDDAKLQTLKDKVANSPKYKGSFYFKKTDLRKENEIEDAFKWITEELGPVVVLVNNVGVIISVYLTDVVGEQISELFDVNVKSLILCSKLAIKSIQDTDLDLHIVNINCISGQIVITHGPQLYHLYSSTKHAVRLISEGLRRELGEKKLHVKVTNINPGATDTEFNSSVPVKPTKYYDDENPEDVTSKMLKAKDVAVAVIYVVDTPYRVLYTEITLTSSNSIV